MNVRHQSRTGTHVKPHLVMISPALANANNGNWQTASRWARMLAARYAVTLRPPTDAAALDAPPDLFIALHARRSGEALALLAEKYPDVPSIVVLTGTDLYRDIRQNAIAFRSLSLASRLVVLQDAALAELDDNARAKAEVIYQSVPALRPIGLACKRRMRHFDIAMIGHLRDEKDPATFMRAAATCTLPQARFIHIGAALDERLALLAEQTQRDHSRYRWLGAMPHADTRQRLKRCHLMALTSRMEGGAHVIIEAITSGVPVVASDIPGNRGMLGDDYAGYFPVGDSDALAHLIARAASDNVFYEHLLAQCAARAPLFAPEREAASLLRLVDNTLHHRYSGEPQA